MKKDRKLSIQPLNNTGSETLDNHHTVYDIEIAGEFVATNGEATFPAQQSSLDDCKKMGSNYYCLYLLRRRYSIRDSFEVALFLNEWELIRQLCKITVRTIPETAVAISNRNTYICSDTQTIQVECTDLNVFTLKTYVYRLLVFSRYCDLNLQLFAYK